jgi:hypothetical protein
MRVEVLTNPAIGVFMDLVKTSKEQLFASPFVKNNITRMVIENRPKDARISLLTSYKLTNFYRGSCDLQALSDCIKHNIEVKSHSKLHAKTYIFDSQRAIVTSANLTLGGLQNNYECGIFVEDKKIVTELKERFLSLFEDKDISPVVTEEIIATTVEILSKVPKEKKVRFEKTEEDIFPEPENDLYDAGVETITKTLSGWRLDVFNAVLKVPENIFELNSVYKFKNELQKLHPENQNIEPKIRQQLQQLRDLGLIEFIQPGLYRKLWKD